MSAPTRWRDPVNELFSFRRDFDDMFERLVNGRASLEGRMAGGYMPLVDSWVDRNQRKYNIRVAIPGIDPKQLDVTLEGNRLHISGETRSDEEIKSADYWLHEFSTGRFERTVVLYDGIDAEKLRAEYKNGVLEISAPVDGKAMPRKIEVKALKSDEGKGPEIRRSE